MVDVLEEGMSEGALDLLDMPGFFQCEHFNCKMSRATCVKRRKAPYDPDRRPGAVNSIYQPSIHFCHNCEQGRVIEQEPEAIENTGSGLQQFASKETFLPKENAMPPEETNPEQRQKRKYTRRAQPDKRTGDLIEPAKSTGLMIIVEAYGQEIFRQLVPINVKVERI